MYTSHSTVNWSTRHLCTHSYRIQITQSILCGARKLFGFYNEDLRIWRVASGMWHAPSQPDCVELAFGHSPACLSGGVEQNVSVSSLLSTPTWITGFKQQILRLGGSSLVWLCQHKVHMTVTCLTAIKQSTFFYANDTLYRTRTLC